MDIKEIKLTPEELEEIKDEVRFRENIALRLKIVENKLDKVNNCEQKIERIISGMSTHKTWRDIHTWLIGIIIIVLGWLLQLCKK